MTPSEMEFTNAAEAVLKRDDVTRVAVRMRQDCAEGIERPRAEPVDSELATAVSAATARLMPTLCTLYTPSRIPSGSFMHLNVARSWIASYLHEAKYTRRRLATLRRRFAMMLLQEARDPQIELRSVVPLPGFECERDFRFSVSRDERLFRCRLCRNAYPMEPWRYLYCTNISPDHRQLFPNSDSFSQWVIIVDSSKERNPQSYITFGDLDESDVICELLLACRLYKEGRLRAPAIFHSQRSFYLMGLAKSTSGAEQGPAFGRYEFKSSDRRPFVRLVKWLFELPKRENLPPALGLALGYFESSYAKLGPAEFLDLAISLEALYRIGSEQTYRLPLRVSALLAGTADEARELYESVRGLCITRNDLAHGNPKQNNPSFRKALADRTPLLRETVRRTIVVHLRQFQQVGCDPGAYELEFGKGFENQYMLGRGLPAKARGK